MCRCMCDSVSGVWALWSAQALTMSLAGVPPQFFVLPCQRIIMLCVYVCVQCVYIVHMTLAGAPPEVFAAP